MEVLAGSRAKVRVSSGLCGVFCDVAEGTKKKEIENATDQ
jgi:hypothetical protein